MNKKVIQIIVGIAVMVIIGFAISKNSALQPRTAQETSNATSTSPKGASISFDGPGATLQRHASAIETFIKRDLKPGSQGDDVKILQEALASVPGLYPQKSFNGYYDAATRQGVEGLQREYNLPVTGEVSGETLKKVNELYTVFKNVALITDIKYEPVSPTSMLVSWTTGIPATTEVHYSVVAPAPNISRLMIKDTKLTTAHAVEITHLSAGTQYYITIVAANPLKNATSTVDGQFVTSK